MQLIETFYLCLKVFFSFSHFDIYRLQQQQKLQKQLQSQSDYVSMSKKHEMQKSDVNYVDVDDIIESSAGDNSDDDESSEQVWSNEIPVYIKGEQRWISGITDETTCFDLIEALLIDEGIVKTPNDANNNNGVNLYPIKVNEYVIIERWRRMEQSLDGRTKILKIWTAWGAEQSEVSALFDLINYVRI